MPVHRAYRTLSAALYALALLTVFGVLGGGSAWSQQITGGVVGSVRDSQGVLVSNADVKARNTATGYVRDGVTGSSGEFAIGYLPVGNYTVTVVAANFKRFVQENVTVAADQTQTLLVALDVGSTTETITVTTAPPLVNTTSETVGRTISPQEINELPLVNRNAYTELSLTPGIQSNSASQQTNPSGSPNFAIGVPSTQVIVNGGVDGGVPMVAYYLDGGFNMTGLRNYGNQLPNPDALEEIRVETSNSAAQYGRMSGAVVSAVTKSGTNQLHGSVFEFLRNTDLDAYSWVPTGAQNPSTKINLPLHRNQFGATVGGPIKRDKAFFFLSYGGLRQTSGQLLSGGIVPTSLEREGDFTQSATKPVNPATNASYAGTNASSNCTTPTTGCVPTANLDPTAANLLKTYIPLPNTTVTSGGVTYLEGYTGTYTTPTTENEYLAKYDQQIGDQDHLFASYFNIKTASGAFGGGNIPYVVNQSSSLQQNLNLSAVHAFSSSKVNQVWLTVTRAAGGRVNLPTVSLGDLGSSFTIQGPKALPYLNVSGGFATSTALAGPVSNTNFYGIRDLYTLTLGHHVLNIGGEFSLEKDATQGTLENYGNFSFSTSGPTTTKNATADFVTGAVASMEQDTPYHSLTSYFFGAGFVQDAWKLTPRLTLNLGLRYDIEQSPVESQNLTAAFVPGQQSTKVPSAPLGVVFPGDGGIPRGIANTKYDHVSPRLGFVLDPFGDGKTAIRLGAGIFYGSVTGNEWNQPANAQPYAVRQTFSSITSLTNVYGNPASFPNGDPFPYTYSPSAPRFLSAAAVEAIDPKYKWPVAYQSNVAVEQQMPFGISLQVAYVGNFVRHFADSTDANAPAYAAGASTSQTSITGRRPYNDNGALGQVILIASGQSANYNSLQVSAHKSLTSHLLLNGFYVWSHSIWSAGSPSAIGLGPFQDYYAQKEDRGPSDNDKRNTSSISGVYKFDYYHGEKLWTKELTTGWKLSAISFFSSGAPFNVTTGVDKNLDGYSNDRPNLTSVPYQLDKHRNRFVIANTGWFSSTAFTPNGPGLPGGIGPGGADGNTPRDYIVGPGFRDIDLAVERDFPLPHGTEFQFRAEATNAFNFVSLNSPTATESSASFSKITSAAPNRIFQFGGRITF